MDGFTRLSEPFLEGLAAPLISLGLAAERRARAVIRPKLLNFTVQPEYSSTAVRRMEIAPIRRQIDDLAQRTNALRGYL
jgi:hypothetical protein